MSTTTTRATPATITACKHYNCYSCGESKPVTDFPPPKKKGDDPPGYCTLCVERDAYFRKSSCEDKEPYCDEYLAADAARRSGGRRSVPLRVYPCEFGDHWHITKREDVPAGRSWGEDGL